MDYRHPNNFHKPFITTAKLRRLVRVEFETLRRWMKLEYFHLSMENPGRGRQRLYSLSDVVQIATIDLLSGVGFMPSLYSRILAYDAINIATEKLIRDYARSEGLEVLKPSAGEIEECARSMGWEDFKYDPSADLPPGARYILLFENAKGQMESCISASPHFDKGVWITVDVYGIVDEIMRLIAPRGPQTVVRQDTGV